MYDVLADRWIQMWKRDTYKDVSMSMVVVSRCPRCGLVLPILH